MCELCVYIYIYIYTLSLTVTDQAPLLHDSGEIAEK